MGESSHGRIAGSIRHAFWLAMAALGTKTNLLELWQVGHKPFLLLLLNTLFIAILAMVMIL